MELICLEELPPATIIKSAKELFSLSSITAISMAFSLSNSETSIEYRYSGFLLFFVIFSLLTHSII